MSVIGVICVWKGREFVVRVFSPFACFVSRLFSTIDSGPVLAFLLFNYVVPNEDSRLGPRKGAKPRSYNKYQDRFLVELTNEFRTGDGDYSMRINRAWTLFLAASLFFVGCSSNQPEQIATVDPHPDAEQIETEGDEYWARENLDLRRVGSLIERAESAGQFEELLNERDGINNLDLNGDGYVDYISVDEFGDRDPNARGVSFFARFGPDVIQEIATILFYRDDPNAPGARILLTGNEQLYGDDQYYEANWLDSMRGLATNVFGDRDHAYRSPYYYDNYPANYEPFEIVDPPAYRTRVANLVPEPAFVQIETAPVYLIKVKIRSPHKGKWMEKVHAKLVKPTKEQVAFISADPGRTRFAMDEQGELRNEGVPVNDLDSEDRLPDKENNKPGRLDHKRGDRDDQGGKGGTKKPR